MTNSTLTRALTLDTDLSQYLIGMGAYCTSLIINEVDGEESVLVYTDKGNLQIDCDGGDIYVNQNVVGDNYVQVYNCEGVFCDCFLADMGYGLEIVEWF